MLLIASAGTAVTEPRLLLGIHRLARPQLTGGAAVVTTAVMGAMQISEVRVQTVRACARACACACVCVRACVREVCACVCVCVSQVCVMRVRGCVCAAVVNYNDRTSVRRTLE
jgi:hypothetical protein